MSMFDFVRPAALPRRDSLATLQETLMRLEAEPHETAQIADLKRILAERIAELERKTA
jgi:hypothetical protein